MPTLDTMFPQQWLRASDVPVTGLAVTIRAVDLETLVAGEKWVVSFHELQKALVLNVTNGKAISKLHGPDTAGWMGKQITLYQALASYKGEEVAAIRVRAAGQPAQPQPTLPLA